MNNILQTLERRRLLIRGRVQGVGFRPFVYRLAKECCVGGHTSNVATGVVLEIEGPPVHLDRFQANLETQAPPNALIESLIAETIPVQNQSDFCIGQSQEQGSPDTIVMPDLATCQDCLKEMQDPQDRRFGYPFTNCVNCGPRYSIIERLPYDRPFTTMHAFPMCADCQREYGDPSDRRFHAQPIACPNCGPKIWLQTGTKRCDEHVLESVADALRNGLILALKSLGGFQLICDASNEEAVTRLRQRKQRPSKPLALMCHNLEEAHKLVHISRREALALTNPAAPIVLLGRKHADTPCPSIAPQCASLGIMLPFTPLHHLLFQHFSNPIVATSGNLSGEPLCATNEEALAQLKGIADIFLLHDRPILNPIDDSVLMVVDETPIMLRRARGYAPLPIPGPEQPMFAMGADMKNCFALSRDGKLFLSPHHGDLSSTETRQLFTRNRQRYHQLFGQGEKAISVCDLHPDYHSSRMAPSAQPVQHHVAHLFAGMAEHQLEGPVLGVIWDGTGYGPDGTIWGGELIAVHGDQIERMGRLLPFGLPGGSKAVLEPRRTALSLLHKTGLHPPKHLSEAFTEEASRILVQMLDRGLNCPQTSAAGRLFDGLAALLGICYYNTHEAAAPCALEAVAADGQAFNLPFELIEEDGLINWDWRPMVRALVHSKRSLPDLAAACHQTLALMIAEAVARTSYHKIILAGGCFQNRLLLEQTLSQLRNLGREPLFCASIPPGDGGIAVGQIHYTAWKNKE